MSEKKFSQFYGKPAKNWANTTEGKAFVAYLEDMVENKRFEELSESEKLCWEDYIKFRNRDRFKVLYDKPAPWKDEELGFEFRNFLKDADKNNKKLSDEEKRCLNNLKDWEKEHPEESADLESGATFSLDNMRWFDIKTPSDVAFFLNGVFLHSKGNKNTAAYVESQWESGKSISQIASYAEQMYQRQLGNFSAGKEREKTENKGLAEKLNAKLNGDKGDYLGFKDRAVVIVAVNSKYSKNSKQTQQKPEQVEQNTNQSEQEQNEHLDLDAEIARIEEEKAKLEAEQNGLEA